MYSEPEVIPLHRFSGQFALAELREKIWVTISLETVRAVYLCHISHLKQYLDQISQEPDLEGFDEGIDGQEIL